MYNLTQGQKLRYLMDRGLASRPGQTVSPYDIAKGTLANGDPITARFIYKVLEGERTITSLSKLEALARYFNVPVAFFSQDPEQWLPPVPPRTLQLAVVTSGQLEPEAKEFLASLAARASELARAYREQLAGTHRSSEEDQ